MTQTASPETRPRDDAEPAQPPAAASTRRLRVARGSPHRPPALVVIVVLAVTAALALVSLALYHDNENRLLRLRVRDAASLLTAAVPGIQTQLASAAELADATGGNVSRFRAFVAPSIGRGGGFASVSLWRASGTSGPITTVGARPALAAMPSARGFIAHAARSGRLSVIGLLTPPAFALGYGLAAPGSSRGFVVYAESPLPRSRHTPIQSNSAFADLDYAIYLGRSERPSQLLLTSVNHLPLRGQTARSTIAFGDSAFTLVMAPRRPLAGTLPRSLPWVITIAGVILALLGAAVTRRLVRRRRDAERLAARLDRIAAENRRLYAEQRDIAQTLQHALLPEKMPRIPGAEAGARYRGGGARGGDRRRLVRRDRARRSPGPARRRGCVGARPSSGRDNGGAALRDPRLRHRGRYAKRHPHQALAAGQRREHRPPRHGAVRGRRRRRARAHGHERWASAAAACQ